MADKAGGSKPANGSPDRTVTVEELKKHDKKGDCWIAVHGRVYDITDFVDVHPGGEATIGKGFGKDGTKLFDTAHKYIKPDRVLPGKFIGTFNKFI